MSENELLKPKFTHMIEGRGKIQNLTLTWENDVYEVSKNTLFLDASNSGEVTPPDSYDRILMYAKNSTGVDCLMTISGSSVAIPILDYFEMTVTEAVVTKIQLGTESPSPIEFVVHFFKNK